MQLKPNTLLQGGKYRIIRTLGQGGFGITYEAEQVLLQRTVAVKEFFMKDCCERDATTLRVTVGTGSQRALVEKFRGKFIREAQMIARMEHPHIVRVTDVFEENGTAYYVMDYLPGGSLTDKVKNNGPLSEDKAENYIRQVAGALNYIHGRNTVHLDVKPSNILLDGKGDAYLIDFGISKHYDKAGEQTSSTPVGLSKGYSPLEQGRDGDVSQFQPSTDIYALGATFYFLLTGKVPPEASLAAEYGIPRPDGLSNRVWNAISLAMKPFRHSRPQSIDAFLNLLDANNQSSTLIDSADKTVVHDKKPSLRKKKWFTISCLSVILVSSIVLFSIRLCDTNQDSVMQPSNSINGHDYVDLGLSVKWATCNVGASSPSDYGFYFAWGETEKTNVDTWMDENWENYKFHLSGGYTSNGFIISDDVIVSKYNTKRERGTVDNKSRLDLSDDAASVNWGGTWRMPTKAELEELQTKCTWTWTTVGGKGGRLVTSKSNGNSIFLPAADGVGSLPNNLEKKHGWYWSSSLDTDDPRRAYLIEFDDIDYLVGENNDVEPSWCSSIPRFICYPVRPVSE